MALPIWKRMTQAGILLISGWYAIVQLFPPALFAHSGAKESVDPTMVLTPTTFGKMIVNQTLKEAENASGLKLTRLPGYDSDECYYVAVKGPENRVDTPMPYDFTVMMSKNRITRFDIDTRRFATARGARVGMLESDLQGLYGNQLKVEPNHYNSKEHVLIFEPGGNMANYAEVFETEINQYGQQVVRSMRSGKKPEVKYIEGCS